MFFLQASTAELTAVAAHPDPSKLSSTPFSFDSLIQAPAIWVALIVICVIVFAVYRRHGKEEKRGFQDTYHEELEAMRKRRED